MMGKGVRQVSRCKGGVEKKRKWVYDGSMRVKTEKRDKVKEGLQRRITGLQEGS